MKEPYWETIEKDFLSYINSKAHVDRETLRRRLEKWIDNLIELGYVRLGFATCGDVPETNKEVIHILVWCEDNRFWYGSNVVRDK